ncbi:ankyrin-2 isoform X9 [Lucilia cuprina]|uniref:ankyrin-2 isoform X9 n=1 Tax=Lucilia cuprina TaxID=7375 RepID=UPI001F06CA19|nr:ankyrin-2 isoform X9 [Lucilia cuprina]
MLNPLKKRFPSLQSLGGDGNTSFLRAARAGNLDKVLEHLKNNIDINTSNANGLNALHLASKDGHIHVVSELLRRGAIVDSATKKGNTALHIASLAGQEEVVKMLLQHGASVNVQSQNGFTPLYMAAQENHDSVVKLLLSNGANQSLATEDGFTPLAVAMQQGHDKVVAVLLESDTRGKVRLPALHIAAKKDDVKAATLLLDNDHNPDVTSKSGFTPLHIASHYGNQAIANLLIQKGADVNFSAKHNISPLHVAAKWGKTNMVSLLLEKGANIEAKTRDGLTPLHCAARSGHEQVVDMLLERGAPISAKTKNGLAPLHMAAQGEHVDAARILLYHRAPVDEVTVDYLTALHVAAHCGHVRVAKLLLDRNADANARALNGFTPLHIACKKNRIKVVELLLRHGASISATTESGLTPLHVAAFMGCMNIVIYLLQHDASPDVPTVRGETPLHLAARANQTDIIRILLRNGAQVDARAREQQTPLHIASRLGNVDIVMLLLQHGAQVDATTKDMYTALHIAAKEGQDEVAAVLIENGAALDAATKKGFTPLHLTAKYGHIKVAQLLLQKEADVDAQGKNGVTPLHVACHYDNQNVALLLLEKGASPHATAKNGHTPLHIAARKNQMDIATTLLEYGAQANAESKAGFTPLHLSCQEGHSEISNLLIEHKAGVNHPAKNGLTPMHLCAQEDNVNVAEILQRNGANIDMATKAGYTPLHVAAHFGQANMVRFLLQHGANVDAATSIGYTPLHQSAQQGHCHIVKLLLEHNANANAQTTSGQTPLDIARKLGYISVLDSLKTITDETEGSTQMHSDEKYRVVAPEAMHESFMSDSEEEGGDTNDWDPCLGLKSDRQNNDNHVYLPYYRGESLFLSCEDNMLSDQPYRYLTVDEMKSLGDDSLPIDVTRDERVDSNRMAQSAEYGAGLQQQQPIAEEAISPHKVQTYNAAAGKSMVDGIYMANGLNEDDHQHVGRKLQWKSFLVSFLVDARGGAMRGCRHSGVRMIIPSRSTCQPTRVTCRYVKPQRTMHPPQLMEGEALASRVLELGPVSTKFIGPVIMEVPHFASLRGKEREIIILRSDNGETWREHTIDNSEEIIHDVLQQCFEPEEIAQLEEQAGNHVCRFVTYDFPQYFAVVTRIRQEVHAIGPEGGMVSSTVVPQVQAVFPQGALTKKIKVGLQAQPVDPDLTAKLLGRGVAVSPIVTVEPRRRKFHKAITLSMPAPKAHSQGMINQYSGNTPTLRLLCSITGVFRKRSLKGGPSRAQWEDVTGSTPLTFVNDCVSFTTTVSARFWLMDCRNISEATKMATELYKEVIHVPFIAKFVVFAKKVEPFEARLRVFCMTDDREDKTLEKMELYTQVAKSRDVEVLEGKPQYIEMAGNLVPVTKSGEQLQLPFKAFRENRLPFTVRVKDQHADIVGRTLFMKEPKVAKGEPPQHPICILNIVLPEAVIPDSVTAFSDKITPTYRSSLLSFSKHQNDHYIGDIRIVDLSNLLGKDWIQLASEINISTEEVDEIINQNTDSIARQAQSMIRLYKDKPNYDIHSLEQALKNIGRDDIMNKCKSGRLSHSRDFDETDIMKNSESVEELVRQESKRIQQIHEREEIKYSAEEKEIEESESDEEIAKRTVAERRDKIVKRLSVERQIPASSQKKEITREITEIKRKSLIEDKKAIHESEIFMQLPADNSVKSAVVPEQVIKMKMGKIDATEVSKSDFDKELTHKFKSSSRSSEEEPDVEDTSSARQISHEEVDNLKIVKDITSVEKPSKIIDSLIGEKPSMESGSKQLTEDFLAFEKLTQLPSQILPTTTDITEKFVEEVKEKSHEGKIDDTIKETDVEVVTETVETASKKVESIISSFESSKPEKQPSTHDTFKGVQDFITAERKTFLDSAKTYTKEEESKLDEAIVETKESIISETVSVKDKIKVFTETKLDDISDKIASTKDSFKSFEESKTDAIKSEKTKLKEEILSETKSVSDAIKTFSETEVKELKSETAKLEQNVLQTKDSIATATEKTADTIVSFVDTKTNELQTETAALQSLIMDTKDTKISETINILQTTKDFISSETKNITEAFKSKIDEVKKETEETKEHAIDKKDSLVFETKSVAETIKAFNEPKIEDVKKEFGFSKESIVRDTKSLFDKSTEEFKEQLSETKETVISETQRVSETIKSFAEPKLEDIEKETSKAKAKVEFAKDSIDKQLKEEVHETKDTIITETKSVAETIKVFAEPKTDDIKKEASKIETKLEETKMSYEKSSEELKKHVSDMKDGIITETKSVTETIKSFTEPKLDDFKKETANLEKEITSTKNSIVKETKSLFDTKTDEFKQHVDLEKESIVKQTESYYDTKSEEIKEYVSDKKDSIITETKTVAETIKAFTEPKIDDIKKESSKIVGLAKDSICEETKTQFDKKSDKVEHLISDSKDTIVEETMSVTETIKTFTEPKIEDIKKDTSKVETNVSEMMETIVTQTIESKTHDFKSGFEEMKDKLSDTEDFIITETKTVAETIKSFSEPKVTTSKIEEKLDDFIDSTKKESKKVSETIKSLSESFDKSSAEPKFEKVKIIPSDKIEDKIADFEAKKVTYEYHGLEPKLRVGLPTTTKAEDEKETIVSAPEAAPRKITTTTEESTFEESLEKLEEMKSIVADARKITKDFLSMEQQSQLPLQTKVEMKEESRFVEETIKTTITFPPIVEKTVTETVTKKVEGQVESKPETKTVSYDSVFKETIEPSVQETILDSRKLTHDFLSMEQKSQLPCEKQTADDISELSTETSQHSVEKSPIIETDSEKISLEHFEKANIDTRKITHDFLSMEQKQQPFSPPKAKPLDELEQTKPSSIIDEVLIKATDIMTTISAGAEIPKDTKTSSKEDKIEKEDSKSILKSEQLIDDGIEKAAPIKDAQEMPSSVVKTLTQDFLTFEQSAPMFTAPKTSTDETKTSTDRPEDTLVSTTSDITDFTHQRVIKMTGDFLSMEQTTHKPQKDSSVKTTDELMAPIPIEPRKSLTDAEFCKSVQESITKKMSEGLIEISDELKIKESDIPHSQTPPPTPIETKIEKEEEDVIQQKPTMDEDNLIDTIKTLHKTTESTFERVSTISTIETLQTYIPEPQPIVSVEAIATQETKSTDITPVPPSSITTTLSQQSHDNADLGAPQGDVPKPKPRSVRISTPTEDVEEEKMSSQMPYEVEEQEVSFDLSDDVDNSVVPVPKPRSQMKTSDSFKNLDTLNQQQHHQPSQSDSISLRSFDYTEETSRTDDPSVSVSISMKSQQLDYPLTTTNTTTTTTSEDPATESIDPPSELSIDDGNVETERKTSFYIGESSRNIITKTTPTKLSVSEGAADEPLTAVMCREPIEATDISLMKEFSVDSDEENDVFKEYVTIKPTEPEAGTRIRRQSSETRNDLLEEDALTKETIESTTVVNTMTTTTTTTAGAVAEDGTLRKTSTEQSFTTTTITSTTSTSSAPLEVIHSTGEDDSVREISESMDIEIERPIDLDLPLEKSEWETTEKEIPPTGKGKIVHSPQQPILSDLTKEALTEEMVAKTLEEVQESLDAAKNELKSVIKDGKSIKESPSEFEFRSFSQTIASGSSEAEKISDMGIKTEKIIEETVELMEDEDISSFIGVPENIQDKHSQETENVITSTVIESLNREAAMLHYAQNIFEEKKPETSLGFVSTGTAESQDSHTSSDDHIVKEERASLGFISSETAEDFSSMEDYYQEKLAKADIVTEAKEEKEEVITSTAAGVDTFGEISSELTMKPFEDVVHRIKTESTDNAQNRWSVPEIDQSSSSESYYKSFEKSESRPLSSDIENLMTQANSSEYQTAADVSSVYRETTEFVSAVSTFESSSGKTISSHESMRSLDSQSETSANLGSIDVSELSETLVASSTEEADELQRLRDLADEEDSDDSLDLETMDYTVSESKIQQQSQMKRSQEMIFKPKSDDVSRKTEGEEDDQEKCIQTVQIKEYAKPKEVEKTWGLTYPIEDTKTDDFKDTDDILLYHGDIRRSIDDTKYASSLDEGSILSVSMSSTSNIDTVVENFEDIVGSVGASSLAGIEGFAASSLPEETTFVMEMDEGSGDFSPQNSTATTPPGETPTKRGHKRSESTSVPGDDIKNTPDKDTSAPQGEGKESESESDTDPYETEYARQFRSPSDRKSKKKKQAAAEMDHSFETEKRPFTPSQLVAEVIVEDSLTEELEAEECLLEERRPSQNMLNYSNIPDITVTEDIQPKSPILEEDTFEEKTLYKVKTQEELHKATDDRPLHEEKEMVIDLKEENFQKLVQEQYKQKLAELQKAEIGDSDYDYNKAPDSPDSFEMVDQPDISDEFVIIEEVAKEANEDDLGGKSIRIAPTKYESKHDEEVEKIIIKSAPADPKLGSQIFRDDLNFEFEESPPTGSSGGAGSEVQDESDSGPDMAANNKRWVEMQLTDNQLRYPYDLTGGVLEDIKEEDGEFEVGSSRISSFKDSFSSTPEYDVMAARRYYAARGEHDDISMSSLQEFESLEQAISLENRNRTHQGSTDSSNGSFQRRYILRNSASGPAQGDDISISSLKEFEGLENACIEAHLIEIKAKEEAAMLSRSDESNKSNGSDRDQILDPTKVVVSKVIRTVTHTEVLQSGQQPPDIETLLKQKLQECERAQSSIQITEISRTKADSDKGSIDSLEMNRSIDMVTSSVDDSFDISKDGTTKSDIDSLEVDKRQPTREESIESIEMEQMDDVMSKFGVTLGDGLTTTTTTTTTSTDADGHEHTTVTTRIITKTTLTGGGASSTSLDASAPEMMTKDFSAESLNQMSALDQTTTSSAGTTATYQTSAGNSQMSGSITSCASSTLMEDSAMSMSGLTMSSSYWSHEEETVKEGTDVKTKDTLNKEDHPPH